MKEIHISDMSVILYDTVNMSIIHMCASYNNFHTSWQFTCIDRGVILFYSLSDRRPSRRIQGVGRLKSDS